MRFTSHRDFSRAFERALVRARVPMAYSSGFNPHPRISYAGAAPTGSASEAEYLEIGLADTCEPEDVRRRLDESLPPGLDVLEVTGSRGGALADRLAASRWRITLPNIPPETAADAARRFLDADAVTVERMTKRGLRSFDCRSAVVSLSTVESHAPGEPCAILEVVLRHGTPSVRPDDVLAGLREVTGLDAGPAALFEREAQGPLDEQTGTVGDPLEPDRDAV
jgi:radical SAM-linked protein